MTATPAPSATSTTLCFDVAALEAQVDELSAAFRRAKPFPHLVIDGLLDVDAAAVEMFPGPAWDRWNAPVDQYQLNKKTCNDISSIPEPYAGLIRQLSEPRFLRALEQVTGISRLIPDPYLTGGGLHLSGPGGILAPHTDFHHYRALNLYRRINVLVYLNEGWSEADGGCLSLYDGEEAVTTVVPGLGRTVIFQTDDRSVHGFPVPVAEGKWRKSVALYYYTSDEASTFSGDETTYWREHGEQRGLVRKTRFRVYRGLLNLSRGISILAHIVNPNQGLTLVKAVLANRRKSADS